MFKLKGKRVLLVGLGSRGRAACRLLCDNGASVVAVDCKENDLLRRATEPLTRSVLSTTCSSSARVPGVTVPSSARRERRVEPAEAAPSEPITQRTSVGRSASSASGSAPSASRASSGFSASGSSTSPSAPMAGSISVRSSAISRFAASTSSSISSGLSPTS